MVTELFPLTLKDAETSRRGKRLVGPLELTLDGQGLCVVIGPNGAGKTTLLRLMHGTARLTGGRIDWACDTAEARHHQAFVFQRPIVLRRTVEENLTYPCACAEWPRLRHVRRQRNGRGASGCTRCSAIAPERCRAGNNRSWLLPGH